jgi:hypothetical protein
MIQNPGRIRQYTYYLKIYVPHLLSILHYYIIVHVSELVTLKSILRNIRDDRLYTSILRTGFQQIIKVLLNQNNEVRLGCEVLRYDKCGLFRL